MQVSRADDVISAPLSGADLAQGVEANVLEYAPDYRNGAEYGDGYANDYHYYDQDGNQEVNCHDNLAESSNQSYQLDGVEEGDEEEED